MKSFLVLALALLCAGCVNWSVPKTRIEGTIAGQPFYLSSPKDSKLTGLTIQVTSRDAWGQTNHALVKIESLEANMNPAVITTTADAQVKMIQAVGAEIRATAVKAVTP